MIKETTAEAGEAMERANIALAEAEQARADYDVWMAGWRARKGHGGPYYRDTGCPLTARALADLEAAE